MLHCVWVSVCMCVCVKNELRLSKEGTKSFKGNLFCPFNLNTFPSAAAERAAACSTIH